jgi:oxygen-independent coproporphyrinogen III oxidase
VAFLISMAGIYIHIPFCKKACTYCNFHFSTQTENIPSLIEAIGKEVLLRKQETNEPIDTIYFGGGTPSILKANLIQNVLHTIKQNYLLTSCAEVTLEANPDDITKENLIFWKQIGINRLSLGIQSFIDEELSWMNRSHTAAQAKQSIALVKSVFENYSIDLIFGSQLLSTKQWEQNIETALSFDAPHLSCYALTVEEKTKLGVDVKKKTIKNIDDKKQAEQFGLLMKKLAGANYVHYEISNYAKDGFVSKHNSSYWQGKQYLGFGPSAHSFFQNCRSWNVSNNSLYISSIEKQILPSEKEVLSVEEQYNEYVMIGIRTNRGVSSKYILEQFGETYSVHFNQKVKALLNKKHLEYQSESIVLTQSGKFFADAIAVDLFTD